MRTSNKKRIMGLLLLSAVFIPQLTVNSKNVYALENIKPNVNVKQKYVYVEYPYVYEPPVHYFYNREGFKGYLTKVKDTGMVAFYEGYVFSGDKYPIPFKNENKIELLSSTTLSESKTVKRHLTYKNLWEVKDIWYDDGTYRGWLYERDADAYQNSDGTWDVYYVGKVYKIPKQFLPDKLKKDVI